MDNSDKKPVKPIIAEDFDGPPGFIFDVCPSCRIMINYLENPCKHCGQKLIWENEKAARQ